MQCPFCGAVNAPSAAFCRQCGVSLGAGNLLSPGTLLRGRYRIEELLGCGGFGAVYRATDLSLGIPVAIKENLLPSSPSAFQREAKLLAQLRHPNLPRVTDYFLEGGRQYFVMEFIEGEDLDEIVFRKGQLSWQETEKLLQGVFEAVAYLHRQTPPIIHRDIKPSNIKITPDGQTILVDLGIAKVGGRGVPTSTAAQAYSPGFAPYEQYKGAGETDERTDIYALGATLYFCVTGQVPPPAPDLKAGKAQLLPITQLNPSIPLAKAEAIAKAMALDPSQRFQSVEEFWQALTAQPKQSVKIPLFGLSGLVAGGAFLSLMVFLAIAFFRHQATSPAEGGKSSSATVSEVPTSPVSTPTIPRSPSPLPKTEQPVATPPKQGEKPKGASKPIHPPSPPRQPPVSGRQTEQASPPPKTSSPPKSSPPLSPQKQVEQLRREAGEALKEGRYEEAQQKLEKAIAIKEEASLHYELGLIAMQRDNLDLAQKHFERAVQLAPHKADYWASLGWLHLQKDETERAKQLFKKALSLDPNNKRAQEGLRLTE